jgi:hypothetical protein
VTIPPGTTLDSFVMAIDVNVPAGWYVKLSVSNATIGTGTYF